MFRRAITSACVTLGMAVTSHAYAKPVAGWWSGGGMGVIENGYRDGRGTEVLLSCTPDQGDRLYLSASIRGVSPQGEFVVFSVDGRDFEFSADALGSIEMTSRVSVNSMYFLFDALRKGRSLELRFSSHSIHDGETEWKAWRASDRSTRLRTNLPLYGSAKAMGQSLCGRD